MYPRPSTAAGWRTALACLALIAAPTAVAAEWPTQTFRIVDADPRTALPIGLNPTTGFSGDDAFVVALMEDWLGDVGRHYQGLGLAAPSLSLIDDGKGGQAYAVYLNDYPDADPASARYATEPMYIEIDASRALLGDTPPDQVIENLAHELFHAIQRSYRSSPQAQHGNWIIEGQAQALGMDVALAERGVDVHKGTQDDYRLGGREYFLSLPTGVHDETYRTASFWRYLAETLKPGYGYLTTLYSVPFTSPGDDADLRWLDEGLRKASGKGLAHHYANFAVTVAGYVPDRLTKPPSGTPEAAQVKWLERLFGACPTGTVTERSPVGLVRSRLQKNAARCFKAMVERSNAPASSGSSALQRLRSRRGGGSGDVDLLVQAEAESIAALEALWIGMVGDKGKKKAASRADIMAAPGGNGYVGTWGFSIEAGKPQTFIVSNVAELPTTSEELDIQLSLITSSARMASSASGLGDLVGGPIDLRFDRFPMRDIVATDMEVQQKAGIERPCMFRLLMRAFNPEAVMELQIDNAGPILPGSYSVTKGAATEKVPGRFIGGFGFGPGWAGAGYPAEGGTVELTAFGPNLVQGKATLLGRLPERGFGDDESPWPETMTVQAEFSIVPRVNLDHPLLKRKYCFE